MIDRRWRRQCESFDVGPFTVSVGTDFPEVFFSNRGKVGHELDDYLRKASIGLSKMLQGESFSREDMLEW